MSILRYTSTILLALYLASSTYGKLVEMKVNLGGEAVDGFSSEEEVIELPNSENIAKMRFHGSIKNGGIVSNVFRTQRFSRYEDLVLNFPVPDGVYHVELLFAETWKGAFSLGKRVFDVYMGSKPSGVVKVLSQFDPFREGGPGGAIFKKFDAVATQGGLTVALRPIVQNPQIAGVIISGFSYSPALIENLPTVAAAMPPSEDFGILNNIGARLPSDPSLLYDPAQNSKFRNGGGPTSSSSLSSSTASFASTSSPSTSGDMSMGTSTSTGATQPSSYGTSSVGGLSTPYDATTGSSSTETSTSITQDTGYGGASMSTSGTGAMSSSLYGAGSSDPQTQAQGYGMQSQSSQASQYGAPASQYGTPGSQYGVQTPQYGAQAPQYGAQTPQYGAQSLQYGAQAPQFGGSTSGYGQPVYRRRLNSFPEPEGAAAPDFPVKMDMVNQGLMGEQQGIPSSTGMSQGPSRSQPYVGPEMSGAMSQSERLQNGMPPSGLHHGGMLQDGLLQGGLPQDGMPQGGPPQEGMPPNGMPQEGMPPSGMPQEGMPPSGMPQEGMPSSGMFPSGMLLDRMPQGGVPQDAMAPSGRPQDVMPEGGMSQSRMTRSVETPQHEMQKSERARNDMPMNAMPPSQREPFSGQNSFAHPSMHGMGDDQHGMTQAQPMEGLSMNTGGERYRSEPIPSPSPFQSESESGMSNMEKKRIWEGITSTSNTQEPLMQQQQGSHMDTGVPSGMGSSSGIGATRTSSEYNPGRSGDSPLAGAGSFVMQFRDEPSPPDTMSHREYQAQSERMQQVTDAAAAAMAALTGTHADNDELMHTDGSSRMSEQDDMAMRMNQAGAGTETTNDAGFSNSRPANNEIESRYAGGYGTSSGEFSARGAARSKMSENTARFGGDGRTEQTTQLRDSGTGSGTGNSFNGYQTPSAQRHATGDVGMAHGGRLLAPMDSIGGSHSMALVRMRTTDNRRPSIDGDNLGQNMRPQYLRRGLHSGGNMNTVVRPVEPNDARSTIGAGNLGKAGDRKRTFNNDGREGFHGQPPRHALKDVGRTSDGAAFVDATRESHSGAFSNGGMMGTSAGIHNGNGQLDGICLHNQTHCSCGEVLGDGSAGERCLFVKNEEANPMICVRGPCSGKWKCGCSPGANNMCTHSLVKSILVAIPGHPASAENDVVLCKREELDEGMYVLTPVL